MPLSDDQKAMLRLLARDQSYEDIAALMGLSVDEVVARAQGAVAQLEAEGIPAPTLPEASGGAAVTPPDPVEKAPEPPKAEEKPAAKEPEPAPAPPAKKPPPAAATPPPSKPSAPKKPRDRGMLLAIGGGVFAVVVIIVLLVLLISNGDGDDSGNSTANGGDDTAIAENGGQTQKPTTAQLVAVDGSSASGTATFGRVEESLGLGIRASGLEQLAKGSIYMVWLAESPQKMLPLTAVVANKAGRINASYQVPTEAVIYLATGEFDDLVITRANNKELRASLEAANKEKNFPGYTGDAVLEGQVIGPIIGAAKRLEERQKERKEEAE
ncbi:MAG TPA: Lrp/AsnC family transcriptional regulator [Solirubrobacterales bacterium]|nr:Lrp/AsnC family transcriptional regulator [Solirubrobacterales bacterium]